MTATCNHTECDQHGIAKDVSGLGDDTDVTITCGGCGQPCTITAS